MASTNEPIISVSGLRGIIGTQLTPLVATRYVAALASTLPKGEVVIARDGRASGSILAQVVGATLNAHGHDTCYLDVAATPTVGVAIRARKAIAGVQISASHNPKEYNGLKLFGSDGRVLSRIIGEGILSGYRSSEAKWVEVDSLGQAKESFDAHAAHLESVLATVDVDAIRGRNFKVLLDSNHGAGAILGRRLLEALGCEITIMGEEATGNFAHTPEPLAINLESVASAVKTGGFDVGFCQDPDADRLAIIDERGTYIGEELTLALCLRQALENVPGADDQQVTVVTNCATSSVSKAVAEQAGCRVLQSAVGEANVADLMIAENAVFGGEGNGGPIDPSVGYVRDSFVGMARVLSLLTSSQSSISELTGALPVYSMIKDKIAMSTEGLPDLYERLIAKWPDAQNSQPDGLKLQWQDRWLLVRGSNTEPIVRFIAEAPSAAEAQELCDAAKAVAS